MPVGNGFSLAGAIGKFSNSGSSTWLYQDLTSLFKSSNNKEKKKQLTDIVNDLPELGC